MLVARQGEARAKGNSKSGSQRSRHCTVLMPYEVMPCAPTSAVRVLLTLPLPQDRLPTLSMEQVLLGRQLWGQVRGPCLLGMLP